MSPETSVEVLQNVTVFCKCVFIEKSREHEVFRGKPYSNTAGILTKRGNLDTETDIKGKQHMGMKAEMGMMHL